MSEAFVPMRECVSLLFDRLHQAGTRYFLLTDFESRQTSKDIDLFVHADDKSAFEKNLYHAGWFKRKEPALHTNHHFYYAPDSETCLDVKFDLSFTSNRNRCVLYKRQEEALALAVKNQQGIFRPQGLDAVLLYAAHIAFKERGRLEQRHKGELAACIRGLDPGWIAEDYVIEKILKWMDVDFPADTLALQKILAPYFRSVKRPMVRSKGFSRFGWGINVLFLGTDGSGKTSVLEAVKNKMCFKQGQLYLGMGESGWSSKVMKRIWNTHFRLPLLERIFIFFKSYLFLPAEFLLRVWPVKKVSRHSIVFIDRFPGTYLLDNHRIRKRIYKWVLPRPDLVFFLYAEPEVLVQRKPEEVTLEKSRADIRKFRKVAEVVSGGQFNSIDTSQLTVGEVGDMVVKAILKNQKVLDNLLVMEIPK